MKKSHRVHLVSVLLDEYFPSPEIPLRHVNSYTLLIAVLLSARSTDAMVNRISKTLFEKVTTPEEMMTFPQEELRSIIQPCGLSPQKSKAILELSKILLEKHHGEVPHTFEELEALPGVGHKTASVVMAQAFHFPAFPVDTHIFRCSRRWGLSVGKNVKEVEADLKKIFPKNEWIKRHLQIIYFARKFCPARGHRVEHCPICLAVSKF